MARCREARQFLFASLLLADQLIDKKPDARRRRPRSAPRPIPRSSCRAEALADRLELLAMALENDAANP